MGNFTVRQFRFLTNFVIRNNYLITPKYEIILLEILRLLEARE